MEELKQQAADDHQNHCNHETHKMDPQSFTADSNETPTGTPMGTPGEEDSEQSSFLHLPSQKLPDISDIWYDGKLQFKKDVHTMQNGESFTVEGEWMDGVPHGVCIVENEKNRGVLTFTKGKEHGGPKWLEGKVEGFVGSYEYVENGLPRGVFRAYGNKNCKANLVSTNS